MIFKDEIEKPMSRRMLSQNIIYYAAQCGIDMRGCKGNKKDLLELRDLFFKKYFGNYDIFAHSLRIFLIEQLSFNVFIDSDFSFDMYE